MLEALWASFMVVKNLPAMQETQVQSLDQKDPLEKGNETYTLPYVKQPVGLAFSPGQEQAAGVRAQNLFLFSASADFPGRVAVKLGACEGRGGRAEGGGSWVPGHRPARNPRDPLKHHLGARLDSSEVVCTRHTCVSLCVCMCVACSSLCVCTLCSAVHIHVNTCVLALLSI